MSPNPSEGRRARPSGATTDDVVLVRRTLDGDGHAFDELVERYQGKIYNLALRITGRAHDAKDATQSAFLKAYENLGHFDPGYKFFSWLYRIGVNESLNIVNRRRRTTPIDGETPTRAAGPQIQALAGETGRAIEEVLAELTPDLRITIVLRHLHGLAYREMSEVLDIPVERVKSRLFSARLRLRKRLAEKGLAPGGGLLAKKAVLYAYCLLLGVLPVTLFLLGLVALDSYKLVRPWVVVGLLATGAGVAFVCLYLNPLLQQSLRIETRAFTHYLGPTLEEALKGSVLIGAIVRRRVGFLVDAAIWGFAVGAGFAAVENIHYFLILDRLEPALWIIRGFGTALMHGGATAIAAVVSRQLTERRESHRLWLFAPGLLLAILLHSAFNQFFLSPGTSTLLILFALPLLFVGVFWLSERATQSWLGAGFDTDQELLRLIKEGRISGTRVGRYLRELKQHFAPQVVADMLCLIRLHVKLSIKAKGILLMKSAGFEPKPDPTLAGRFEELRYLEGSIGKTGLLALHPIFHMSGRDLWQLNMLGRKAGGLTNFLRPRR